MARHSAWTISSIAEVWTRIDRQIFLRFAPVILLVGLKAEPSQSEPQKIARLQARLFKTVWVAYAATNYNPEVHPPVMPRDVSIRADLRTLKAAGFTGLVTYGSDLAAIPRIAEEVGFESLLLGVWAPADFEEMQLAKKAARSRLTVGVIVGNEGLMFHRYTPAQLKHAMDEIRHDTGKPVSTTEIIEQYFTKPELAEWSDFLTVNAHPYFHSVRDPSSAVEWTTRAYHNLADRFPRKPLLFKEVGLPTGGEGLNEKSQLDYYEALCKSDVKFVFFEAFDAQFKKGPMEQSWGLFHTNRTPKPAVAVVRRVAVKP
jgi:exo-beta-1,3-glucanase (GH17 family)